ncbi:hypothetical protein COCVIDRAFT_109687, partial [Bipolaris victoriae FI3]
RHVLRSLYRSKSWSDASFWLAACCGCAVCGSDSVKILVRLGCARGLGSWICHEYAGCHCFFVFISILLSFLL